MSFPLFLSLMLTALWAQGAAGGQGHSATDAKDGVAELILPLRVVSLLPSLTETVCALGQCQQLVGVDRYSLAWLVSQPPPSNHRGKQLLCGPSPPTARARCRKAPPLPQDVGGGIDPAIEAIAALRPDVILASVSTRGVARLRRLGFKVLTFNPQTYASVEQIFLAVGRLFQLPREEVAERWDGIEAAIERIAKALPPASRGLKVYIEVSPAPYAAGEASFIGETLTRLGGQNIVPAGLGTFPKLNPEFIVRADPALIIVGEAGGRDLAARPGWQGIEAIRSGRLCLLPTAAMDAVVRPGPRLVEAAAWLAQCLRLPPRRLPQGGAAAVIPAAPALE